MRLSQMARLAAGVLLGLVLAFSGLQQSFAREVTALPKAVKEASVKQAAAPKAQYLVMGTCTTSMQVDIVLATQRMMLYCGDAPMLSHPWKVSTAGIPGYTTPIDTFHPQWTARRVYSPKFHVWLINAIVLDKDGDAVHAAPAGTEHQLGKPASHGCIRLAPENAAFLYDEVQQLSFSRVKFTTKKT